MPDTGHTFEAYLKRATTPLLVLQMLSEQPMYPYQIMQEVNKRSGGVYKMPLLYTVMDRLQQQGFVYESKKEISESNRVRNYYALTEAGGIHLQKLKEQYSQFTSIINEILFPSDK
ncbi:PadR family transcriptional regulator [Zhenpiania hominis]|uniref:PadR family transcriptional regulator n=1 Tax=Zhenpiania hominis TaxID=2763644 RepID=UPI0039F5BB0F